MVLMGPCDNELTAPPPPATVESGGVLVYTAEQLMSAEFRRQLSRALHVHNRQATYGQMKFLYVHYPMLNLEESLTSEDASLCRLQNEVPVGKHGCARVALLVPRTQILKLNHFDNQHPMYIKIPRSVQEFYHLLHVKFGITIVPSDSSVLKLRCRVDVEGYPMWEVRKDRRRPPPPLHGGAPSPYSFVEPSPLAIAAEPPSAVAASSGVAAAGSCVTPRRRAEDAADNAAKAAAESASAVVIAVDGYIPWGQTASASFADAVRKGAMKKKKHPSGKTLDGDSVSARPSFNVPRAPVSAFAYAPALGVRKSSETTDSTPLVVATTTATPPLLPAAAPGASSGTSPLVCLNSTSYNSAAATSPQPPANVFEEIEAACKLRETPVHVICLLDYLVPYQENTSFITQLRAVVLPPDDASRAVEASYASLSNMLQLANDGHWPVEPVLANCNTRCGPVLPDIHPRKLKSRVLRSGCYSFDNRALLFPSAAAAAAAAAAEAGRDTDCAVAVRRNSNGAMLKSYGEYSVVLPDQCIGGGLAAGHQQLVGQPFTLKVPHTREGVLCFFWDLEATGLDVSAEEITQIACVCRRFYFRPDCACQQNSSDPKYKLLDDPIATTYGPACARCHVPFVGMWSCFDDDGATDEEEVAFNRYVSTNRHIPEAVVQLTGITTEFLRAHGVPLAEALRDWRLWVLRQRLAHPTSPAWLVAHNGNRYDIPLLFHQEVFQLGVPAGSFFRSLEISGIVDTVVLSRRLQWGAYGRRSHRLQSLFFAVFNRGMANEHDALGDVCGLAALMTQEPFLSAWREFHVAWSLEEYLEDDPERYEGLLRLALPLPSSPKVAAPPVHQSNENEFFAEQATDSNAAADVTAAKTAAAANAIIGNPVPVAQSTSTAIAPVSPDVLMPTAEYHTATRPSYSMWPLSKTSRTLVFGSGGTSVAALAAAQLPALSSFQHQQPPTVSTQPLSTGPCILAKYAVPALAAPTSFASDVRGCRFAAAANHSHPPPFIGYSAPAFRPASSSLFQGQPVACPTSRLQQQQSAAATSDTPTALTAPRDQQNGETGSSSCSYGSMYSFPFPVDHQLLLPAFEDEDCGRRRFRNRQQQQSLAAEEGPCFPRVRRHYSAGGRAVSLLFPRSTRKDESSRDPTTAATSEQATAAYAAAAAARAMHRPAISRVIPPPPPPTISFPTCPPVCARYNEINDPLVPPPAGSPPPETSSSSQDAPPLSQRLLGTAALPRRRPLGTLDESRGGDIASGESVAWSEPSHKSTDRDILSSSQDDCGGGTPGASPSDGLQLLLATAGLPTRCRSYASPSRQVQERCCGNVRRSISAALIGGSDFKAQVPPFQVPTATGRPTVIELKGRRRRRKSWKALKAAVGSWREVTAVSTTAEDSVPVAPKRIVARDRPSPAVAAPLGEVGMKDPLASGGGGTARQGNTAEPPQTRSAESRHLRYAAAVAGMSLDVALSAYSQDATGATTGGTAAASGAGGGNSTSLLRGRGRRGVQGDTQ